MFPKNSAIDNILISNKVFSDKKNYRYFIGYKDDFEINRFCITLLQTNPYVKTYDNTST